CTTAPYCSGTYCLRLYW
nr:immunoglobulin heavy chain junction region [Macaca mulatta]MOW24164.1 immunoglobulin heavy chain junction region [Macaca mulatta]MOW25068.1 immunoglobulin heavy chain junction region [Macaca mulatta]MOW26022.1 immunoglobulin heavy chain junction region [Macaca mulatta]MOW26938.1 immunoglobulin heavy chain junction region [Macaca mulatta]